MTAHAFFGVALASLGCLAWLTSCDDSEVWHEPEWSLERMMSQPRVDPFDHAMAQPPPFTVARGEASSRERPAASRALVERGAQVFERVCSVCHGLRGDGESVVATKMLLRPPPSLLEPRLRALDDDAIHRVVEHGYGLMPPFAGETTGEERWAVVAYVRALQIAGGVQASALPQAMRDSLAREAP